MAQKGNATSALLRFVQEIVNSVTSGLMNQIHVLQEQAIAPIRNIIQQVVNGIWIGEGAKAFVEELSTLLLPDLGKASEQVNWLQNGIKQAGDLIMAADQANLPLVNELGDLASNICGF